MLKYEINERINLLDISEQRIINIDNIKNYDNAEIGDVLLLEYLNISP